MKIPARNFLLAAFACVSLLAVRAVDDTASPPPADTPPATVAPAAPPTESSAPAATESEKAAAPQLRRLDEPSAAVESKAEDNPAPAEAAPEAAAESAPAPAAPAEPKPKAERRSHAKHSGASDHGNERVSVWHDSTLAEGERAEVVVSIFGSSTANGDVNDSVVSVMGSSTATKSVGNAVVSVFGDTHVSGGPVGDVAVAVLGSTHVDAKVGDAVVAVLGNVVLGPNAEVNGDVICIGGEVIRDPKAIVHGQTNNVAFGVHVGNWEWFHTWVKRCLLLGRPLAFGAHLMWAWWLAIAFLGLYVVLALLFPRTIEKCTDTLEQRPGKSILTALVVTLLTPAAAILLAITIIGTPALVLALFVASIFGKTVMLLWFGRRVLRLTGAREFAPALGVLAGGVLVLLLYTVPVLGFVVAKLNAWIGIGVVVYTLIQGSKRAKAVAPAAVMPAAATVPAVGEASAAVADQPAPATPPAEGAVPAAVPPAVSVPLPSTPPRLVAAAATLPRAGFWIRIAASLLDVLIVAVAVKVLPHFWEPNFLLAYAAYCTVLWGMRGTTIGGIVCNLKVVRLDDRPVDWTTALVRALGGFLSLFAAGVGFIWVAFDEQKQSWHDKIAGTTIVIVPKGVSLV